jgi:RNA recognition motif-containing protein
MCALHVTDLSYPIAYGQPVLSQRRKRMKLYVGNLPHAVTDDALREAFAPYGTVKSAMVVMDQETVRSRGFGFVEMSLMSEAQAAIQGLNGKEMQGRTLTVNEARPRENRNDRGGSGGRGGGGGRSDDRGRQSNRRSW